MYSTRRAEEPHLPHTRPASHPLIARLTGLVSLAALAILALAVACTGTDGGTATPAATAPPLPTTATTATPQATPTPAPTATATPTPLIFAPDGRTGLTDLDALINLLIDGDAAAIQAAVGDTTASVPTCSPRGSGEPLLHLPLQEWTATLAAADRALYSVTRKSEITEALDVILSLTPPDAEHADLETRWRFTVTRAVVSTVEIPCDRPGYWGVPNRREDYVVAPPLIENDVTPSDDASATPPALDDDGWPVEAQGPLVVFSYRAREERDPEQPWVTWSVVAIVTYDTAAGRELGRFELDERTRTVEVIGLSGPELLIDRGPIPPAPVLSNNGVFAFNLAGEELRPVTGVYADAEWDPVLSPDGLTLAGVSHANDDCEQLVQCIAFAPIATNDTSGDTTGGDVTVYPNPGVELAPVAWTADGRAVLARHITRSESAGPLYLVTREGEATELPPGSAIAPGGAHIAGVTSPRLPWVEDAFGCQVFDTVTVSRVGDGAETQTISPAGVSIGGNANLEWSPDGRSLLIIGHATPDDTTEGCLSAFFEWQRTPEQAFRYSLDTGRTTEVADPNALRADWIGTPLIATRCLDAETIATPAASGLWPLPTCIDAGAQPRWTTLLIDGRPVATLTTLQDAAIVAIVDLDDLSDPADR